MAEKMSGIERLHEIMTRLRDPQKGCPWDREQTLESLKPCVLEETYELLSAMDRPEDKANYVEELGDVLLQVVFHSDIASTNGFFGIDAVCDDICKKLITRHPHVFGDVKVSGSENVLANWDKIKKETKQQQTDTEVLRSITRSLPALMRADKLGKKARKMGYDFDNAEEAMEKVFEEAEEVREAIKGKSHSEIEEEFGDLLLSVVNAARLAGVDSEQALYNANEKFLNRFQSVEEQCFAIGKTIATSTREEKEDFWQKAKKK
jgi:tetrapyrrole methylase family protein/MazG family protein